MYLPSPSIVPAAKRAQVNQGVLNLIRGHKSPPQEAVYQAYTGKGGLHGLQYKAYAHRHAYTKAKQEFEGGQFFTPHDLAGLAVAMVAPEPGKIALDPTSGAGVFFNFLPELSCYGCELDPDAAAVARYLYPSARIEESDIRAFTPAQRPHYVFGNPPFGLRWQDWRCPLRNEEGEVSSEGLILWKISEWLRPGGTAALIVPAGFLEDDLVHKKEIGLVGERFWPVAKVLLPQNAFQQSGAEVVSTKLIILVRAEEGQPCPWTPSALDGSRLSSDQILEWWKREGNPSGYRLYREMLPNRWARIEYEGARAGQDEEAKEFAYQFWKTLYHLRTADKEAAEVAMTEWAMANKPKPADISYDVWMQNRLRPETVLRNARKALKNQHRSKAPRLSFHCGRQGVWIETNVRGLASDLLKERSAHELAGGQVWDPEAIRKAAESANRKRRKDGNPTIRIGKIPNWKRMSRRLQAKRALWSHNFTPEENGAYLAQVEKFYQDRAGRGIKVFRRQVEETAALLPRPHGFEAWQQGCGKSLSALCWEQIKREEDRGRGACLLVTSALAIELHWEGLLTVEKAEWARPRGRREWEQSPASGFILCTHYELREHARLIQRLARAGRIRRLIVDESDEFASHLSERPRALIHVARAIKNRLLTTGTPCANQAGELFHQLEVILHGTGAFLCVGPHETQWDKKEKCLREVPNPEFGQLYQPFRGYRAFQRTHAPQRPTVLGEQRSIPMTYQREELDAFLEPFRRRLTLEELLGRPPTVTVTHPLPLTAAEETRYRHLAKTARETIARLLEADHGSRKSRFLAISEAIRCLQQALSARAPSGGMGSKARKILELIEEIDANHIMVGTIWRETVPMLAEYLKKTGRRVVSFDGEVSFSKRRVSLDEARAAGRSVIVTTQGAMRSSLDCPWIGAAIAESLPWNLKNLSQWAFRCVRLSSPAPVPVHLIIPQRTIEERILGLLMRKEHAVRTLRGDEFLEIEEIGEELHVPVSELEDYCSYLLGDADRSIRPEEEPVAA